MTSSEQNPMEKSSEKITYAKVNQIEEEVEEAESKQSYRNEYIAAFAGTISIIHSAICFAWTATSLPLLIHPDSPIQFEHHYVPYVVSFLMLGAVPGSIMAWALADRFGRHRIILWLSIPYIVADLLIAFATNVNFLLLSRFISGLAVGASFTVVPVYISEIASTEIRGKLSTLISLCNALGMLYQYSLPPYLTIRSNALVMATLPVVMFVILLTVPESPYYLIMKNREEEAISSLRKLRKSTKIGKEYQRIKEGVEEESKNKTSPLDLFKIGNFKALRILFFAFGLQQACGVTVIVSYSQIFLAQTGTNLSINFCGAMVGFLGIATVIFSASLIENFGRIQIFKYSCLSVGIVHFILLTFFYFQSQGFDVSSFSLFPVLGIVVFKSCYFFGLGSVPFLLTVELMPTKLRAFATCFFSMVFSSISICAVFFYDISKFYFGDCFPFGVFGLICILGAIVAEYVLFETKGKTLEQIQEEMAPKVKLSKV